MFARLEQVRRSEGVNAMCFIYRNTLFGFRDPARLGTTIRVPPTLNDLGMSYPRVGGWGSVEEAAHVVRKVVPSAHLIEANAEGGCPSCGLADTRPGPLQVARCSGWRNRGGEYSISMREHCAAAAGC